MNVEQEFAVQAAPIAELTWDVGPIRLLATDANTGAVPVRFSSPLEILGIKATVIPVLPLAGGFPSPTLEDIDVLFEQDENKRFTAQTNDSGRTVGGYVPLAHLVTDANRLLRIQPGVEAPDLQFTFAWRQFVLGTPYYQGAIISLSLLYRRLEKGAE